MEKFVCKHQKVMAWCKIHDCEECGFKGREDKCPFAHNLAGDTVPTFAEAIAAYRTNDVSARHASEVERTVTRSIALVGLTPDDKVSEMGYERFEALVAQLTDQTRVGGPLRPESVKSAIAAFRSVSSPTVSAVRSLRTAGRDPFSFAIPKFSFRKPPKQTVTVAQARKVVVAMEALFASGKASDLKVALYIYFAIFHQMRGGDICNLKWGDIKMTADGIMLVYVPHKTARTSDEPVSLRLAPMEYEMIRPYVKPGEYVITRHEDRIGGGGVKSGIYVGFHKYTRKRVSEVCKAAGIGLEYPQQKKGHALRKYRETVVAAFAGIKEAARRSHHSEHVARANYVGSEYSLVADTCAA